MTKTTETIVLWIENTEKAYNYLRQDYRNLFSICHNSTAKQFQELFYNLTNCTDWIDWEDFNGYEVKKALYPDIEDLEPGTEFPM